MSVEAWGAEAAADWATLRSPENYTGYERTENFGPITERTFQITFPDPGAEAYAFTFG